MIPFTTCLRLNRKRHKEGRQQQSSGTASEELVAKPTTSLDEASKAEQEFDREVEESLEARRCAWRLMEQRMAEPGAKKIIPPAMTTTAKTTTIHTSHGRPSIQVDVDIHSTDEEEKTKVTTTDTADCSMRALMLMKSIDLTDEVGSFTLSVGRRRSSSSIRFADDTDTGTDILIITEEDLEEILSDPVYGCSPVGRRSTSQRRQSSHSLLSEEAYAAIPAPIAQHRRLMRGRRSLISPSVHRQLLQSGGVFGMSVGGTGAVAYSPSPLEGKSKTQSTRLLLALRRRKSLSRSIHMDPIALLDFSYDKIVKRLLQSSSSWKFSSFTLDTLTGGHSLSTLLVHLFQSYGLVDHFKLDMLCLWKCFHLFEQGYHDTNPYHNSVHAADVTQAMHCFIQEKKIGPFLTPMETMCAILAAVAHDLDHPGVNQHFLIATNSHLAALYNNVSVLESHHWRFAISCIKESQLFSHFSQEQWAQIRHLLKSLILATDITQQAGYLIHFRKCLQAPTASSSSTSTTSSSSSSSPSPAKSTPSSSSSSSSTSSSSSSSDEKKQATTSLPEPSSGLSMSLPENRLFILKIALKCADLANPCRSWQLSRRWSEQICSEFYRQGDYERQLNLPVTPIFNRYEASMAKIQTDFFQNVVTPLFELWDQFLASDLSSQLIANLNFNYNQWLSFLNKKMINRRHSMISSVSPELGMITIAKRRAPKATSSTATATRTSVQLERPFSRHRSLGALTMLQPPSSLLEAKSILRPKPPSSLPSTSRTRKVQAHTRQAAVASASSASHAIQVPQGEEEQLQEVHQPPGPQSPAPESRQFQCDGIHGCGTPSSLGSPGSEDFSDPSSIASGSADDVDIDPLSQRHPLTSHVSEEEGFSSPDEEALDHLDDHPAAVHGLAAAAIPPGLSAGITLHSSHPLSPLSAQMFLDRGQYLGGRRGSAPGCIGVYASAELAAAALVFLQGALTNSTAVPRRSSAPVEAGRGSFSNHHYGHHYHHHNQNNRKNSNNSNRSHRSDETHNAVNRQKAMGWTNPYGQGKRGRSMEVLTVSQSTAEA